MSEIEDARRQIRDFRESVIATIVLKDHFENYFDNTDFNFGGKLKKNGETKATPDLFIRSEHFEDLVGELKRSLPNPPEMEDAESITDYKESERFKRFVGILDDKLGSQILSYNDDFENVGSQKEVFLLFNERYDEGLNVWYDESEIPENNSFVGLSFRQSPSSEGEKSMSIKLYRDTEFDQGEINDLLRIQSNDWKYSDAPGIIGKNNIAIVDESHQIPMPYLMLVLWQNIFEELKEGEAHEKVLERLKRDNSGHKYTIEADVDTIQEHLDDKYTLRFFDDGKHAQREREQFKKSKVKKAMKYFTKIDLTDVKKVDNDPAKYEIVYEELSQRDKDAIGALIESLEDKNLLDKSELHGRGFEDLVSAKAT